MTLSTKVFYCQCFILFYLLIIVLLVLLATSTHSSDDSSDDCNGLIIVLVTLLVIAVIGLVISIVINVFLGVKLKQSRRVVISTVHTSYNLNVTRMVHACVDHELLTQFCCKRVTLCVVSSEPQTREKYMSYVCMYARFFIQAHACINWLYTHTIL